MAPPNNRNDFTDTGVGALLVSFNSRFDGLERAIAELQKVVTAQARVELSQIEHSKAVDRAFAKIVELEEKIGEQQIKMHRLSAVIEAGKWGVGLLGGGGIASLIAWLAMRGGGGA